MRPQHPEFCLSFKEQVSVQDLDPAHSLQAERLTIMKEVIDAESLLYIYNVEHRELFPRNVLVLGRPGFDSRWIVIVNFGKSAPTSVPEQMKSIWLPSFLTRPPL
ncbi:predicted protein [Histoplasma capsulatum H143]|uniref:Protein kinase domain-containing protein n=1 Tax=Ajellomyces capsulatus (strain H143) TaxID=544712 RepID=C6HG45_AJECH|nr:predicted protein [Histoplasma capsulatum H143]